MSLEVFSNQNNSVRLLNTEKRVGKKANVCVTKSSCQAAGVRLLKKKRQKEESISVSFSQVSNLVTSPVGKNQAVEGVYSKASWLGCLQVTLKMAPNVSTSLLQEYFCAFTAVEWINIVNCWGLLFIFSCRQLILHLLHICPLMIKWGRTILSLWTQAIQWSLKSCQIYLPEVSCVAWCKINLVWLLTTQEQIEWVTLTGTVNLVDKWEQSPKADRKDWEIKLASLLCISCF